MRRPLRIFTSMQIIFLCLKLMLSSIYLLCNGRCIGHMHLVEKYVQILERYKEIRTDCQKIISMNKLEA